MSFSFAIRQAGRILKNGGVVAYPTEGVFGLGCIPDNICAVERILAIKQRDASKGLILIADTRIRLENWIDVDGELPAGGNKPITWIVPASPSASSLITGRRLSIAVRITSHAVAAALCEAAGSALVSTSANIAGRTPAANIHALRRQFHTLVDYIVPGRCGPAHGPSEIRDLTSGLTVRRGEQ